jgi:23S rRNA (uracil1939-C5)-methyltransferase
MKEAAGAREGRRVRLRTETMSYGPHAVARAEGKVVFVRNAAPDEEVEVAVTEEHRRYAFADLLRVIAPSPQRRPAPCPFLPRCGGCAWQHLDYASQLRAKRALVAEHLRRIARVDANVAEPLASPLEFGYRHRLKLRVDGGRVGFFAGGSHDLVEVDHCLLAAPRVDAAIPTAARLVRALRTRTRRLEIVAGDDADAGLTVIGEAEGAWVEADEPVCRAWMADHAAVVAGLLLAGRGWRRSWGAPGSSIRPSDALRIPVGAGTFTQVNPLANRLLVRTVLDLAGEVGGRRVLDLYAGAGNLSLPLAQRGAEVTAIEGSRQAVSDARAAADRLGLGSYRAVCERVDRALAALAAAGERFDVAVLDPPRSGAQEAVAPLLALRPPRLLYVSCDPTTLARDLGRLSAHYRVERVQPIDMFPQTYHVETVTSAIATC